MFTAPIGNFPAYTTTVRPTANTVVSGSVNNAANAYDADPATYADFTTAVWTVQTVPGGVIGNPTIYVTQQVLFEYLGGSGTSSYSVVMSTDGGTTYPYTIFSGGGTNAVGNISIINETSSVYIAGSVNLANIKIKISSASTGGVYTVDNRIYDVRVVY